MKINLILQSFFKLTALFYSKYSHISIFVSTLQSFYQFYVYMIFLHIYLFINYFYLKPQILKIKQIINFQVRIIVLFVNPDFFIGDMCEAFYYVQILCLQPILFIINFLQSKLQLQNTQFMSAYEKKAAFFLLKIEVLMVAQQFSMAFIIIRSWILIQIQVSKIKSFIFGQSFVQSNVLFYSFVINRVQLLLMMSFAQNIQQCFLILLLFYQQLIFLQTIDNIQVRQMYNKPDIEIFKQIIRNLHNLEYVSPKLLQQLSLSQKNELSCYAGLINLLYNIAREGVQIIEIQKRSRVANLGMQQDAQQQPEQFNGHILKIRGQIIRQYAKMLAPVLPEPAYSLARFNFADFNAYCIRRDIGYLLRHTRGIYPLIDIKKTPLLRFLPFYNQLKAEQSLIVGNQNWKLARKIMNIFYQQQVKTDKIFESQMDIQENNQVDYSYERGGIKLSYILLTQGHQQMESFIKNLENDIQGEQKNNIKKLKFWYQNYSKFVEQGLYTYQINKDENNKKLIYNLTVENFEQNIMSLIQKVVQLKKIQQNQNRNFILQQIAEKLVQIVQSIEQDNIVPRNQNIQNQFQYKNANKMLLLSYINVITKCLFQGQEVRNVVLQAYKKLTQNEPVQQIFNFIFYNQNQILQLYSSNKLTKFPINFNYGTQLMPKILQKILNNHPENIVQNLKRLDILESEQQLKFIMKNRMIGNVDGIVQNQFSAGQIIIDYLQDNKKRYIDLINPVPLFMPKQNERGKQLQKFIDQWRQFYSFIRKFDFDIFKNYLKVYTQLNQKNLIEKPRGPENKSEIIKIKGPLYRPNIFYQIITALLKQIKKERNTFLELLQEKNLNMTKHPKSKLIDYYNIFSKPSFKSMLIDADPTFVFDEIADPNAELEKQKFQDQVWRVYADGVLIIQDMSRKIIVQGLASPQKNKKNTNLFMRSQQQRVNNFEIIQQSSQYNESNDQNMQNQV